MYKDLDNQLRLIFEQNEVDFNKPLFEGANDGIETADDDNQPDDQDGGDQESDEASPPEKKEQLPPEEHPDMFAQPDVDKGIIYINPLAIPNDYSKGHMVAVYKVDTHDKKVRTNELKLGAVPVPFGIIKNNNGKEYVSIEDIKTSFNNSGYVISLLKRQPKTLDRFVKSTNKGLPGDDAKRVPTINPNVQEPSGELKGDKKDQDALRRFVGHRVAGTRGGEEMGPQKAKDIYSKDVDSGNSEKERMKLLGKLSPEQYKQYIAWQKQTGSRDVTEFMKSLKNVAE